MSARTVLDPVRQFDDEFSTIKVSLASHGFALHRLADRSFLVSRWDQSRHLNDMRALRAFVARVAA